MSKSRSEGDSPARSNSRDREEAIAAIINSLHGAPSENLDTQDQETEAAFANGEMGPEVDAGQAAPPLASDPPPLGPREEPPPPPPPPSSVQAESIVESDPEPQSPDFAQAETATDPGDDRPPPPPPTAQAESGIRSPADEPPPPPPPTIPAEIPVRPEPKAKADFASSSAMVKDILSAGPDEESDEDVPAKLSSKQDSELSERAPGTPLTPDFFTSAKSKRRRWRPK
jgi:hypothetical protein